WWHVETGLPKTAEEIATMEGISLEEAEKIVEELKALQASSENSSSSETSSAEDSAPLDFTTEKNGIRNSETSAIVTPATHKATDAPTSQTAQATVTTEKTMLPNTGSQESVLTLIGTSIVLGIGLSQVSKRKKAK
uniref:LPXTG cell wall anchor domain-containing protein n=1 Tax=Streptococcus suis TaxID=1307 RepID=UPI001EE02BB1